MRQYYDGQPKPEPITTSDSTVGFPVRSESVGSVFSLEPDRMTQKCWLWRNVICPRAPEGAERGYDGDGWIGEVYWDKGDRVRVAFKGTKKLKWFPKSDLILLKP